MRNKTLMNYTKIMKLRYSFTTMGSYVIETRIITMKETEEGLINLEQIK